jgi:hypothetical protein
MNTWKIILATIIIFATGVVTGGLLVARAQRTSARQVRPLVKALEDLRPRPGEVLPAAEPGPGLPERRRLEFILAVHRELRLTPDQRQRIEKIVREGQEKTKAILEKTRPELREQWREVREKIRAELTPPQRKRFEELLKQRPLRLPERLPAPGREPRGQRRLGSPPESPPAEGPPTNAPPDAK